MQLPQITSSDFFLQNESIRTDSP